MQEDVAQEFTNALDETGEGWAKTASGWWRQIGSGIKLGIPRALGQSRDDWAAERRAVAEAGALSIQQRQKAVAELTGAVGNGGEGLNNSEAADVLGVDEATVRRDRAETRHDAEPADAKVDGAREPKPEARHDAEPAKPKPTITLYTHKGEAVQYPEPQGKSTFNATPDVSISWAAWSWNPVTGCEHGCAYCYAREIATSARAAATYPVGFTPLFHHERLDAPANTSVPRSTDSAKRRVFVCSMADLYGRWVPKKWIDQVHAAELENPQWTYIHLTKFPKRYLDFPLPRTGWIGASVDEQKRVKLTEDAFRQIDGVALKWLSLEPLLAPLEFSDLSMFDWVVIGAQTATRQPTGVVPEFAPRFEWVMQIVAMARQAGCRIHMKPNLLGRVHPQSPGMELLDEYPEMDAALHRKPGTSAAEAA
jgi:protein gp37